ncbi:cupin domain-containing protein [Thiomicrorhabdus xiamenensis]|uniref:Cupin domain-containing protein n=1 Tax=Thiomicrorhabdus xiamenensis TaxID=2739063 RepID=A0A7D4TH43_9GAMM|nr:cupin domain-containing protein [Thiomicrorhabdus xiamenensis]QKI89968.1 cupin domain-containing protein [Thiomicrorhabdus xiamenensis]
MQLDNIFKALPENLDLEIFETLVESSSIRIERIVSKGHTSPERGWYDQNENEWVLVLEGKAILEFSDGTQYPLTAGDYLNIPAHTQHKVAWSDPDKITIWLAVFYL